MSKTKKPQRASRSAAKSCSACGETTRVIYDCGLCCCCWYNKYANNSLTVDGTPYRGGTRSREDRT
jgi:hypothetical protein